MRDSWKRFEEKYPELMQNVYCGFYLPEGWESIVTEAFDKINDYPIRIAQVKEKFGGLRIYYDTESEDAESNKYVSDVIREAEAKSYKTCLTCGKPGKVDNSKHWIVTLCEEHRNK